MKTCVCVCVFVTVYVHVYTFILNEGVKEQQLFVGWQLAITGANHVSQTIVHRKTHNSGRDAPSLSSVTEAINARPAFKVIPL